MRESNSDGFFGVLVLSKRSRGNFPDHKGRDSLDIVCPLEGFAQSSISGDTLGFLGGLNDSPLSLADLE